MLLAFPLAFWKLPKNKLPGKKVRAFFMVMPMILLQNQKIKMALFSKKFRSCTSIISENSGRVCSFFAEWIA